MSFPSWTLEYTEELLKGIPTNKLAEHYQAIHQAYDSGQASSAFSGKTGPMWEVYTAARMPATYAAFCAAWAMAGIELDESTAIADIGSGPGTAGLALREAFGFAGELIQIEHEARGVQLSKELASRGGLQARTQWVEDSWERGLQKFKRCDWGLACYFVGELSKAATETFVRNLWNKAEKGVFILAPGTPRDFAQIREIKTQLEGMGGYPLAPCTTRGNCPLPEDDWCHFNVRIPRTRLHQRIKGGSTGYEDERFSFVAYSKENLEKGGNRLIAPPEKQKGFIELKLCHGNRIERSRVLKRDKEGFRKAKKMGWGDWAEER